MASMDVTMRSKSHKKKTGRGWQIPAGMAAEDIFRETLALGYVNASKRLLFSMPRVW